MDGHGKHGKNVNNRTDYGQEVNKKPYQNETHTQSEIAQGKTDATAGNYMPPEETNAEGAVIGEGEPTYTDPQIEWEASHLDDIGQVYSDDKWMASPLDDRGQVYGAQESSKVNQDSQTSSVVNPEQSAVSPVSSESGQLANLNSQSSQASPVRPESGQTTNLKSQSSQDSLVKQESGQAANLKPQSPQDSQIKIRQESGQATNLKPESNQIAGSQGKVSGLAVGSGDRQAGQGLSRSQSLPVIPRRSRSSGLRRTKNSKPRSKSLPSSKSKKIWGKGVQSFSMAKDMLKQNEGVGFGENIVKNTGVVIAGQLRGAIKKVVEKVVKRMLLKLGAKTAVKAVGKAGPAGAAAQAGIEAVTKTFQVAKGDVGDVVKGGTESLAKGDPVGAATGIIVVIVFLIMSASGAFGGLPKKDDGNGFMSNASNYNYYLPVANLEDDSEEEKKAGGGNPFPSQIYNEVKVYNDLENFFYDNTSSIGRFKSVDAKARKMKSLFSDLVDRTVVLTEKTYDVFDDFFIAYFKDDLHYASLIDAIKNLLSGNSTADDVLRIYINADVKEEDGIVAEQQYADFKTSLDSYKTSFQGIKTANFDNFVSQIKHEYEDIVRENWPNEHTHENDAGETIVDELDDATLEAERKKLISDAQIESLAEDMVVEEFRRQNESNHQVSLNYYGPVDVSDIKINENYDGILDGKVDIGSVIDFLYFLSEGDYDYFTKRYALNINDFSPILNGMLDESSALVARIKFKDGSGDESYKAFGYGSTKKKSSPYIEKKFLETWLRIYNKLKAKFSDSASALNDLPGNGGEFYDSFHPERNSIRRNIKRFKSYIDSLGDGAIINGETLEPVYRFSIVVNDAEEIYEDGNYVGTNYIYNHTDNFQVSVKTPYSIAYETYVSQLADIFGRDTSTEKYVDFPFYNRYTEPNDLGYGLGNFPVTNLDKSLYLNIAKDYEDGRHSYTKAEVQNKLNALLRFCDDFNAHINEVIDKAQNRLNVVQGEIDSSDNKIGLGPMYDDLVNVGEEESESIGEMYDNATVDDLLENITGDGIEKVQIGNKYYLVCDDNFQLDGLDIGYYERDFGDWFTDTDFYDKYFKFDESEEPEKDAVELYDEYMRAVDDVKVSEERVSKYASEMDELQKEVHELQTMISGGDETEVVQEKLKAKEDELEEAQGIYDSLLEELEKTRADAEERRIEWEEIKGSYSLASQVSALNRSYMDSAYELYKLIKTDLPQDMIDESSSEKKLVDGKLADDRKAYRFKSGGEYTGDITLEVLSSIAREGRYFVDLEEFEIVNPEGLNFVVEEGKKKYFIDLDDEALNFVSLEGLNFVTKEGKEKLFDVLDKWIESVRLTEVESQEFTLENHISDVRDQLASLEDGQAKEELEDEYSDLKEQLKALQNEASELRRAWEALKSDIKSKVNVVYSHEGEIAKLVPGIKQKWGVLKPARDALLNPDADQSEKLDYVGNMYLEFIMTHEKYRQSFAPVLQKKWSDKIEHDYGKSFKYKDKHREQSYLNYKANPSEAYNVVDKIENRNYLELKLDAGELIYPIFSGIVSRVANNSVVLVCTDRAFANGQVSYSDANPIYDTGAVLVVTYENVEPGYFEVQNANGDWLKKSVAENAKLDLLRQLNSESDRAKKSALEQQLRVYDLNGEERWKSYGAGFKLQRYPVPKDEGDDDINVINNRYSDTIGKAKGNVKITCKLIQPNIFSYYTASNSFSNSSGSYRTNSGYYGSGYSYNNRFDANNVAFNLKNFDKASMNYLINVDFGMPNRLFTLIGYELGGTDRYLAKIEKKRKSSFSSYDYYNCYKLISGRDSFDSSSGIVGSTPKSADYLARGSLGGFGVSGKLYSDTGNKIKISEKIFYDEHLMTKFTGLTYDVDDGDIYSGYLPNGKIGINIYRGPSKYYNDFYGLSQDNLGGHYKTGWRDPSKWRDGWNGWDGLDNLYTNYQGQDLLGYPPNDDDLVQLDFNDWDLAEASSFDCMVAPLSWTESDWAAHDVEVANDIAPLNLQLAQYTSYSSSWYADEIKELEAEIRYADKYPRKYIDPALLMEDDDLASLPDEPFEIPEIAVPSPSPSLEPSPSPSTDIFVPYPSSEPSEIHFDYTKPRVVNSSLLHAFGTIAYYIGMLYAVWAIIKFALGLHDYESPNYQAIWQFIAASVLIFGSMLLKYISTLQ